GADRGGDRAFKPYLVLTHALERRLGQKIALLLQRHETSLLVVPRERETSGFQDTPGRFSHFRPDTIAGDQCDGVSAHLPCFHSCYKMRTVCRILSCGRKTGESSS